MEPDRELRETIVRAYKDVVLTEGEPPASAFKFCRDLAIQERDFFRHFSSLKAVEAATFADLIHETRQALDNDADYSQYEARQKWLAFCYTYIEVLKGERSWVLDRFPRIGHYRDPRLLRAFDAAFLEYADTLVEAGRSDGSIAERGRLSEIYPRAFLTQIHWITAFFCDDESSDFERTDAAIEKSVQFAFDLVGTQILDTGLDLFRFLIGTTKP